ncbi:MAG: tetratricopeptide repeat protein [Gallionella sp.]|nr:MAG: tetratricopeptide repeat protein [Gallionella sp.]
MRRDEALAASGRAETAAIRKHIQAALEHHQAGRISQAEALCQQALRIDRNHPDALHLLGVIARQAGKYDMAAELINRAIRAKPSDPVYYNDLGIAYNASNRPEEAIASYRHAIAIKPDCAEAHNNMGNIFKDLNRLDEAIACYHQAIRIKPKFAEAHFNLGNIFKDRGRLDEAAGCYQKSLAIKPGFAEACCNLGVALGDLGKIDAAIVNFQKALRLKPDLAEAHNNLGGLLKDRRKLDEAIPCFRKALAIKPDYADAYNNLGDALKNRGEVQEAIACCQKALSLAPGGLPGLDSAVRLATLYYLQDDLPQASRMIGLARPILGKTGRRFRAAQAYCQYADKLLSWWSQADPAFRPPEGAETIYAIGDSHILSAHNVPVLKAGKPFLCRGRWIEGCKQWHLGNGESNPYKDQFNSMMESIPHHATILMCIGEIDCRPDEGILKALKKYPGKTVEDIALATATAYLKYVSRVAAARSQKIIIGGVPATNLPSADFTGEELEQLAGLLDSFNRALREHSLKAGMDFLDVFAMTGSGGGISDGRWHLDSTHLRPDAIAEAFGKHYRPL